VQTSTTPTAGRPRATSQRAIELVALQLFAAHGFDATTVEEISDAASVSKRTFFRYFASKAEVIWSDFQHEVTALRALLAEAPQDQPVGECVKAAVLQANRYRAEDAGELRIRMQVIATNPEMQASAAVHYDAWAEALADFAAGRLGLRPDDLLPRSLGLSALAVCRAAFEQWVSRPDRDLTGYLEQALDLWLRGFAELAPVSRPGRAGRPASSSPGRGGSRQAPARPRG
jgi:mycofactocin system transcriptional regulator